MTSALAWLVRLCGLVGWVAGAVACAWLLGAGPMGRPWHEPLVWGGVAAGCAGVRVVALWALVLVTRREREPADGVSLAKGAAATRKPRETLGDLGDTLSVDGSEPWVKGRTAAVWLLVAFASGAFFACLMTMSTNDRVEKLRDAGAEVGTARVVGKPLATRAERDDEDQIKGYASRLVVTVSDGPRRLTVKGAYTYDKPRAGTRLDILWARSAPELGGYVNESKDLPTLAAGRWKAFADDELGEGALIAFIICAVIGGLVMAPVFTLVPDADSLQYQAWSVPVQTIRGAFTVAQYLAWRPIMLGHELGLVSGLVAGGGFVLVLLFYVFTSIQAIAA
ncbi:hypothetical protein [Streptomyces sp. NPDC001480]|uniref:hypothetical protein n=1 Tax=Streptomyces sp. NPDC001480 TaxID=3364577 RepID=UPI0036B2C14C